MGELARMKENLRLDDKRKETARRDLEQKEKSFEQKKAAHVSKKELLEESNRDIKQKKNEVKTQGKKLVGLGTRAQNDFTQEYWGNNSPSRPAQGLPKLGLEESPDSDEALADMRDRHARQRQRKAGATGTQQ